jgi:hypothetical protein
MPVMFLFFLTYRSKSQYEAAVMFCSQDNYKVELTDPTSANETRGSFAGASRFRGYITRVLTKVMTPIHQDASAITK